MTEPTEPTLRDQLADVLREKFNEWIAAEWICCDPPAKGHKLCKQGHAARRMVASLLADDPEAHPPTSPILDALMPVVEAALAEQATGKDSFQVRASCCEDGERTYGEMERHLTERAEQAEREVARLTALAPLPSARLRERFWAKVARGESCWEWQGHRQHNGYGRLRITETGKEQAAHRIAWQITYGFIPEGFQVCHRCDNPPCVNPAHLFLGTKHDNMRDCAAKGRNIMQRHPERSSLTRPRKPEHQVRGERQGNARLTEEQVTQMRAMKAAGKTSTQIADAFGVSAGHVRKVTAGKAWAHVRAALTPPEAPR